MKKRLRIFIINRFPLVESENGWAYPNPIALLLLKLLGLYRA